MYIFSISKTNINLLPNVKLKKNGQNQKHLTVINKITLKRLDMYLNGWKTLWESEHKASYMGVVSFPTLF